MHDPMTVAFEIKWPIWKTQSFRNGQTWRYFRPLLTIWHVDPERDGTDDSCGWFIRARHVNQEKLKRLASEFDFDWDKSYGGWFRESGEPYLSPIGITLNMFWKAAWVHFGQNRDRANRFMRKNLLEILMFAENPTDSLHDTINGKYGFDKRSERIEQFTSIVYSWVCRADRPWWKHPRWHFWHWQFQWHDIQAVKRWMFSRCSHCGRGFKFGESPVTYSWNGTGPQWFRSEKGVFHGDCDKHGDPGAKLPENAA